MEDHDEIHGTEVPDDLDQRMDAVEMRREAAQLNPGLIPW